MKNWTKKLTKEELRHVRSDAGCNSLADFKENRRGQKALISGATSKTEVCWTCRKIAIKLGLEK